MSAMDPTQSEIENLKTMAEVFDWAGLARMQMDDELWCPGHWQN